MIQTAASTKSYASSPGMVSLQRGDVGRILGLPVLVSVTLAEREMSIEAILGITIGTIIEFEVHFGSELVLNVCDHPIGLGQAVKIGENFGLRITAIDPPARRVEAMGVLVPK